MWTTLSVNSHITEQNNTVEMKVKENHSNIFKPHTTLTDWTMVGVKKSFYFDEIFTCGTVNY